MDNGTINPGSDGVINIQPGQFPLNPGAANTTNPISNIFPVLCMQIAPGHRWDGLTPIGLPWDAKQNSLRQALLQ